MPPALAFTGGFDFLFRRFYPMSLHWADRRPIGSLVLATAATGWRTNPRGWFLDPSLDVITSRGRAEFRTRLLAWADESVATLRAAHAQGMLTWDIEGEEYAHPTTYIGDPRLVGRLAPEMEGAVDEYFDRFHAAGLRVGVTIRPQTLRIAARGRSASQAMPADAAQLLIDKIGYARRRWNATLFYLDSNGDRALPLDFSVVRRVTEAFPDILLIPEHQTLAYYSAMAPYGEVRAGATGTPDFVRRIYPDAFSVVNVADASPTGLAHALAQATAAGDIVLFRGWFRDPANALLSIRYSPQSCPATDSAANLR